VEPAVADEALSQLSTSTGAADTAPQPEKGALLDPRGISNLPGGHVPDKDVTYWPVRFQEYPEISPESECKICALIIVIKVPSSLVVFRYGDDLPVNPKCRRALSREELHVFAHANTSCLASASAGVHWRAAGRATKRN
jgi:hypothetical protein